MFQKSSYLCYCSRGQYGGLRGRIDAVVGDLSRRGLGGRAHHLVEQGDGAIPAQHMPSSAHQIIKHYGVRAELGVKFSHIFMLQELEKYKLNKQCFTPIGPYNSSVSVVPSTTQRQGQLALIYYQFAFPLVILNKAHTNIENKNLCNYLT